MVGKARACSGTQGALRHVTWQAAREGVWGRKGAHTRDGAPELSTGNDHNTVSHLRVCAHSVVPTLLTPCTVAYQTPLSMEFSRQEGWSKLPFRPPGDLPHPGIKPASPALARGYANIKKKSSGEPRGRRCGRMDCFSRSHRVWNVGKPGLMSQDNKITGLGLEGVGVKGLTMCFRKKKNSGGPEGRSEKARTQGGTLRGKA